MRMRRAGFRMRRGDVFARIPGGPGALILEKSGPLYVQRTASAISRLVLGRFMVYRWMCLTPWAFKSRICRMA